MAFAVQLAKGIFDLVRDDLALVEQEIAAQNGAAIEPVSEISSYYILKAVLKFFCTFCLIGKKKSISYKRT